MTPEKRKKTVKLLSLVLIIAGLLVIIGWFFDIGAIKRISPAWVSMKFTTAAAFVLSGIILYFIVAAFEGDFDSAQIILSIASLIIILMMGLMFFSTLFHVRTGEEDLLFKDVPANEKTVIPGRPSLPTMFNFMLTGVAGILTILNPDKSRLKLRLIGFIIALIGALALLGYIIDNPVLYYYVEGENSAMAFHTAVLFVLLGAGFLCL